MKPNYLTRSLMFVPAHNIKLLESAIRSNADILLLDIEDSCQPSTNKVIARENIVRYIKEGRFDGRILFPRINERQSGEMLKDVLSLTVEGVTGFMYPKATCGADVYFFSKLLEMIEIEKGMPVGKFKIIPLIETTGALYLIQDICKADEERVVAVAFGHLDYVNDLQGRLNPNGRSTFTARSMIAAGARSCNVIPIDTIHPHDVHDLVGLEEQLNIGKDLGYEGMLVLNPCELPLVHQYYSPSEKEISWAKEIIRLSEEAEKEGKGVAIMENKFIGPPMVKMAKEILEKAEMCSKQ